MSLLRRDVLYGRHQYMSPYIFVIGFQAHQSATHHHTSGRHQYLGQQTLEWIESEDSCKKKFRTYHFIHIHFSIIFHYLCKKNKNKFAHVKNRIAQ